VQNKQHFEQTTTMKLFLILALVGCAVAAPVRFKVHETENVFLPVFISIN
jgi:hypothetical protein